ncbi:hypothetical protein LAZ67_7002317 [Cordylochernes scorpioides]|uniref:Uncharacterized protein n=1 Tax=Cordylochernes scorpioides TaxID=51811 RepID=A0ABY6KR09_9ARAC|nr:hypothetical protein LAZ67_7002317 [Cordylochernes scorpioides]
MTELVGITKPAEISPTKAGVTIASDCRSALAVICSLGPTHTSCPAFYRHRIQTAAWTDPTQSYIYGQFSRLNPSMEFPGQLVQFSNLNRTTVKNWVAAFKLGRISTKDEHGPGRPVEAVTQENIDKIHDLIMLDRRMTVSQIEETLCIPKTAVDRIMREHSSLRIENYGDQECPKRFSQPKLNDLTRDLRLSKQDAELLASRLKEMSLLEDDVILDVLSDIKKGLSYTTIMQKYKISKTTVYDIKKSELKLTKFVDSTEKDVKKFSQVKNPLYEIVDKAVNIWYESLEPDVPRYETLKSLDVLLKYLEKRTEPEMLASYNTINSLRTMLMREEEALLNMPKK